MWALAKRSTMSGIASPTKVGTTARAAMSSPPARAYDRPKSRSRERATVWFQKYQRPVTAKTAKQSVATCAVRTCRTFLASAFSQAQREARELTHIQASHQMSAVRTFTAEFGSASSAGGVNAVASIRARAVRYDVDQDRFRRVR